MAILVLFETHKNLGGRRSHMNGLREIDRVRQIYRDLQKGKQIY
ncbi:MAG: hypothetical protein UY03_C0001G0019 [Parcubacteria group bacterium GW2011_GWA2_47_64]|nr:MAG: hypothetical protein UY03_C0001G0019 [Parcubacteria group bacterium GW2011_GWA2_47_64]KKU96165.1 MAG: hypothetical protein UY29_C0015G0005 [Parcubacteria group bacterium GW2011_GWC2_48_17]